MQETGRNPPPAAGLHNRATRRPAQCGTAAPYHPLPVRHLLRYLPACLTLLGPLAFLAYLGSSELSRQQERAETFLRGLALDVVSTAAQDFDQALRTELESLFDEARSDEPSPTNWLAVGLQRRQATPELVTLIRLDAAGRPLFPRLGPTSTEAPPFSNPPRATRSAAASLWVGDAAAAETTLRDEIERRRESTRSGDLLARLQAQLQLAGLHAAAGDAARAAAEYRTVIADATPLEEAAQRVWRERGRGRRRFTTVESPTVQLLARVGLAEVTDDHAARTAIATEIGDGQHWLVADGAQIAILTRIARTTDGAEITAAQRRFEHLVAARSALHAATERASLLPRQLDGDRVLRVFDTPLTTCLLALQAQTDAEGTTVGWHGAILDLTGFLDRVLGDQLESSRAGFHLDVIDPDGNRLLRQSLPPDAASWPTEIATRSDTIANLQFSAVPRNPSEQLENRRASQRNLALLVLALCLVAGGAALFLVRSSSREAELAAMKVGLVSRVSHELKTPLSMIKMYGETLALGRAKDTEQSTRFARIISREADRLTALIDRVLDFSKHSAGSIHYRAEPLDLAIEVRRVLDEYEPHIESAGATLQAELEPNTTVLADRAGLASSLVNLLENAIKYTPADRTDQPIEVSVHRRRNQVVLEVSDRGIGVPAAERDKIFDSFFRAGNAGAARGAGLGLSLVRHFASAHGGTAEAVERVGDGTTFRISLPGTTLSATPHGQHD